MPTACPSDFTDHARTKTNRQLAEKYGVGEKTVTRWRKETGCTAAIRPFASAALPKPQVPPIAPGTVSEAAQYLRKTYRPVYHRVIEGREYRGQYVVGTQVLSEQEVVELAEEKGLRTYNQEFLWPVERPGCGTSRGRVRWDAGASPNGRTLSLISLRLRCAGLICRAWTRRHVAEPAEQVLAFGRQFQPDPGREVYCGEKADVCHRIAVGEVVSFA